LAELLEAVELTTGPSPRAAVIWLHGLGADGHDFPPVVPELRLPSSLPVRFVFPHAPMRSVTINMGMMMRAWYDIRAMDGARQEDEAGVRESQRQIEALIARERERGMASRRIALIGFSQGGAMALHTGVRYPERLAGIAGLSCGLPLADRMAAEASPANRDTPIFVAHGRFDDLVPMTRGRQAVDTLTKLGYTVSWHEYPMPHSVCAEEIADLSSWLQTALR
jgi:phospholipase/carboxylesterase